MLLLQGLLDKTKKNNGGLHPQNELTTPPRNGEFNYFS